MLVVGHRLGPQAVDADERPVDGADDVGDAHVLALAGQPPAAALATDAHHDAGAAKVSEDRLEKAVRDVLEPPELLRRDRRTVVARGDLDQRPERRSRTWRRLACAQVCQMTRTYCPADVRASAANLSTSGSLHATLATVEARMHRATMGRHASTPSRRCPPWRRTPSSRLLVFGEAAFFIGFVLPGETAVVLRRLPGEPATTSRSWRCASLSSCRPSLGDTVGYEVGKHYGPRAHAAEGLRPTPRRGWTAASDMLRRRGGPAVFLGRFTAFFRAVMPGLAGLSQMRYRTFLPWNALGGFVWGVGFSSGRATSPESPTTRSRPRSVAAPRSQWPCWSSLPWWCGTSVGVGRRVPERRGPTRQVALLGEVVARAAASRSCSSAATRSPAISSR